MIMPNSYLHDGEQPRCPARHEASTAQRGVPVTYGCGRPSGHAGSHQAERLHDGPLIWEQAPLVGEQFKSASNRWSGLDRWASVSAAELVEPQCGDPAPNGASVCAKPRGHADDHRNAWSTAEWGTPDAWRPGRQQPRNLYEGDRYVGVAFDPVDTRRVIDAMNARAAGDRKVVKLLEQIEDLKSVAQQLRQLRDNVTRDLRRSEEQIDEMDDVAREAKQYTDHKISVLSERLDTTIAKADTIAVQQAERFRQLGQALDVDISGQTWDNLIQRVAELRKSAGSVWSIGQPSGRLGEQGVTFSLPSTAYTAPAPLAGAAPNSPVARLAARVDELNDRLSRVEGAAANLFPYARCPSKHQPSPESIQHGCVLPLAHVGAHNSGSLEWFGAK
jgi:hypothetical protein